MRLTRRAFSNLPLAAAASACSAHLDIDLPGSDGGDTILANAMAGASAPGMAALVIRDFRVAHEYVAGVRRLGAAAPVQHGDRWHLGSDGKAITAACIARLVERGALSWEAPLARLLPDLAASMRTEYRDATLPDLLSHRAGLPENIGDLAFFASFGAETAPPPDQRLRYIAAALAEPPAAPARAERSYSNTGFIVAAAAAERAAGLPFEALLRSEVFDPLDMHSTSFQPSGAREPIGHVDGRVADQPSDSNPAMFAPAGGMRMSLRDWARFCIDQMAGDHGGGRLLRTGTYRFLHAPQGETRSALGWGVAANPMELRGPALTHSGSDGNWMALVVLFLETGNGVLAVANAAESMGGDRACTRALRAYAGEVAEAAP